MRSSWRRLVAPALVAVLGAPAGLPAQEPTAAGPTAAKPTGTGVAGSWWGWARLTNDWPGLVCRYDGESGGTSVALELSPEPSGLRGSVAIDLPAEPGSACPPLRKRYTIVEATEAPGTLVLKDSGGNEWTLAVRSAGTVLQGLLAWPEGGVEQPLAEGYDGPEGEKPLARLRGEVRLQRSGEDSDGAGSGAASAAPPPDAAGVGRHAGNLALVIGANAVALGLLYGANKLGKGSSETGTITCSPRVCIVGAPGAPCFCEGNVVSGGSCGTTVAGAPIGAPCDGKSVPCEASLSCNSGICEDRFGRCPY